MVLNMKCVCVCVCVDPIFSVEVSGNDYLSLEWLLSRPYHFLL